MTCTILAYHIIGLAFLLQIHMEIYHAKKTRRCGKHLRAEGKQLIKYYTTKL